ncbi:MAG: VWA domain-containing protein [Planctomycetota bacterium]|nr:VWA domain-containing protein [Planctomycetota bacterium]MDA1212994.1 VWA domain-containing protein [Planctomycetota bacterium]
MLRKGSYSGLIISISMHVVFLIAMALIHMDIIQAQPEVEIETFFAEDRAQEEFVQEIEENMQVAESISVVSGGVVSTNIGGGAGMAGATGAAASQAKVEASDSLKEPDLEVAVGDIAAPGSDVLATDLGEGEITGETGAVVEGYGDAMGRMTLEIIRMMREEKVLVVWLFDESESMKDDQLIIRDNFHKVYEELGIAQKQDNNLRRGQEILLTSIISYGEKINPIIRKPTADIKEIRAAIDKIPIDKSGLENTCQAIEAVLDEYRSITGKNKRKMIIIVVSDESGDDGDHIEDVVQKTKRADAPVYFMSREAIFGYELARIRYNHPVNGLDYWLPIKRGPETEYPECLQWDGLHARWDSFSSGFGPYVQVRIARESGGIFFLLPGEEENLSGAGAHEQRRFDFLDMKEYQPLLMSRPEYAKARSASKFRATIYAVIEKLDPVKDKELSIRELWYSIDPEQFRSEGAIEFQKAIYAMTLVNQAIKLLEDVQPLRAKEDSMRWRAAYDLAYAQLLSYKVRLFQFMLAMDKHNKDAPKPMNKNSNRWNLARVPVMLEPDEQQIKVTKVDMSELKRQEQLARDMYIDVIKDHPRTPWSKRAEYEIGMGFGMTFVEVFRDPRYDSMSVELPSF